MRIACKILLWNKTASLRDIEVKYRSEPTSVCFIPRARLQFRKPEPRIRRLSWRQFLDVSVMQELAIMRRLTTAVLFIPLNLFPPIALTQTKLPDQSQSSSPAKQQVASRDRVPISEQHRTCPFLGFLILLCIPAEERFALNCFALTL